MNNNLLSVIYAIKFAVFEISGEAPDMAFYYARN